VTKKVALVTGAAAGIGAACAIRLARDGASVGVLDLDAARCQATVDAIVKAGGHAVALGADISDRATVIAAMTKLHTVFGPIGILVNNAAITGFTPFLELSDAEWERVLKVNLTGAFIVTQLALPDMIAAKWGRIINIASSAAQSGAKYMAPYASSKGGMIALTKSLALEFGPDGITANVIPPRFITGTIMSERSFADQKQPIAREALAAAGPICREGRPEDIAGAVAWLASDDASYVTGQIISVNGGRYI
jgi:2-hydroxycyclohexanecarboxyl-CoA dehydrogenase